MGRVRVKKMYKLYVDGAFRRSESERYYKVTLRGGEVVDVPRASKKDLRDAVRSAQQSVDRWHRRSAYNRGQILYRMAEMLESRSSAFVEELMHSGYTRQQAHTEVNTTVDRLVWYAGWCDKIDQIAGTVNPTDGNYFAFTYLEPTGTVCIVSPREAPFLLAAVTLMAQALVAKNTIVLIAPQTYPLAVLSFAEVVNDSDVPAGVVNILSGLRSELMSHIARHVGIKLVVVADPTDKERQLLADYATQHIKRLYLPQVNDWFSEQAENPYHILNMSESKSIWHPVGR